MSIAEKLTTIAENVDKVYDAGKKAEYDAFWDRFQGNQSSYAYAFSGRGWDDTTFRPKYNIVTSGSATNNMFCNSNIVDLDKILKEQNVTMDVSLSVRVDYMFYYCRLLEMVPEITFGASCGNISYMFNNCDKLKRIKGLILPNKTLTATNVFNNCTSLEEITIGGTIAFSMDIHWSTNLTADSIKSIIEHLSDTSSGLTLTLPNTAESNYDAVYGSGAWSALRATKSNWSIVT